MKNILLLISLALLFLLGAKNMDGTFLEEERMEVENVFQTTIPTESILSCASGLPDENEAYIDTETLARQFRVCGRGQRSFSAQQMFFGKGSAYRVSKKHLEMFLRTTNCVYTSLPCQSWTVSSEHYVFGMRRILI